MLPERDNFCKKLLIGIDESTLMSGLLRRVGSFIAGMEKEGCYVWGAGRLGNFVAAQLRCNRVNFRGFISNSDSDLVSSWGGQMSPGVLKSTDYVIIASFYQANISQQMKEMGIVNHVYYEELAIADTRFDVYYPGFQGLFLDIVEHQNDYLKLYDLFGDDTSKRVLDYLLGYRMTLNNDYNLQAQRLSLAHGIQDLDEMILRNITSEHVFFDVGGFDGQSTKDFIESVGDYRRILFFEPDHEIISAAKKSLSEYKNITFIEAGVSSKRGTAAYSALGGGGGQMSETGEVEVNTVCLDDYMMYEKIYIKMDIEGAEREALMGAEKLIKLKRPLLSISVYHRAGDIHRLVEMILSMNSDYHVYLRHYSDCYADTRCYFIPLSH